MTGTRVPQNMLSVASTTLRLPQTVPQALKTQKQNGKTNQKTRPPYFTWTWQKSQKQDDPERNKDKGENRKWNKYFIYIDVLI